MRDTFLMKPYVIHMLTAALIHNRYGIDHRPAGSPALWQFLPKRSSDKGAPLLPCCCPRAKRIGRASWAIRLELCRRNEPSASTGSAVQIFV
jgi:hypothetical protein